MKLTRKAKWGEKVIFTRLIRKIGESGNIWLKTEYKKKKSNSNSNVFLYFEVDGKCEKLWIENLKYSIRKII